MKIALCLYGQPRALEDGFAYYKKNLIDVYPIVDVFCHSWNTDLNDKILDLYKPIKYKFEDYKFSEQDDEKYANNCVHYTSLPRYSLAQFYSTLESRNLKNTHEHHHNFLYDWVIRARFDYALNCVIDFQNLNKDKIYLPIRKYLKTDGTIEKGFCDLIAWGSSSNMNKLMSVYEYMEEYSKIEGFKFYGEHLVSVTLTKLGLRKRHGYPSDPTEQVEFYDMNDPFIGHPEECGRRWVYSLHRFGNGDRGSWLHHEEEFLKIKK